MSERLEEIEEWHEYNHGASDWKVVSIKRNDYKYLIEQAKRYDECRLDAMKLHEENKRYREAITEVNEIWDDVYKQYKRDKKQYLDGMLDGLETALETFVKALESEQE